MKSTVDCIAYVIAMGILATAFMDLWAMAQKRLLGIPSLDYAMVGRWLGHMPRGIFLHTPIGTAKRVPGEVVLGWSAHYAIGMLFAAMFVLVMPDNWRAGPTLWPALLFGAATVTAPYFILQPAMGAGLAARKTPKPNIARLRSFVAHLSFGMGLYIAGKLLQGLTL